MISEEVAVTEHSSTEYPPANPREESAADGTPTEAGTRTQSLNVDDRLEALAQERDSLREEVAWFRKSLEAIEGKHEEELSSLQEELVQTQEGKTQAEAQYKGLLGKVSTIRSQLGERLKADAVRETLSTHDAY